MKTTSKAVAPVPHWTLKREREIFFRCSEGVVGSVCERAGAWGEEEGGPESMEGWMVESSLKQLCGPFTTQFRPSEMQKSCLRYLKKWPDVNVGQLWRRQAQMLSRAGFDSFKVAPHQGMPVAVPVRSTCYFIQPIRNVMTCISPSHALTHPLAQSLLHAIINWLAYLWTNNVMSYGNQFSIIMYVVPAANQSLKQE